MPPELQKLLDELITYSNDNQAFAELSDEIKEIVRTLTDFLINDFEPYVQTTAQLLIRIIPRFEQLSDHDKEAFQKTPAWPLIVEIAEDCNRQWLDATKDPFVGAFSRSILDPFKDDSTLSNYYERSIRCYVQRLPYTHSKAQAIANLLNNYQNYDLTKTIILTNFDGMYLIDDTETLLEILDDALLSEADQHAIMEILLDDPFHRARLMPITVGTLSLSKTSELVLNTYANLANTQLAYSSTAHNLRAKFECEQTLTYIKQHPRNITLWTPKVIHLSLCNIQRVIELDKSEEFDDEQIKEFVSAIKKFIRSPKCGYLRNDEEQLKGFLHEFSRLTHEQQAQIKNTLAWQYCRLSVTYNLSDIKDPADESLSFTDNTYDEEYASEEEQDKAEDEQNETADNSNFLPMLSAYGKWLPYTDYREIYIVRLVQRYSQELLDLDWDTTPELVLILHPLASITSINMLIKILQQLEYDTQRNTVIDLLSRHDYLSDLLQNLFKYSPDKHSGRHQILARIERLAATFTSPENTNRLRAYCATIVTANLESNPETTCQRATEITDNKGWSPAWGSLGLFNQYKNMLKPLRKDHQIIDSAFRYTKFAKKAEKSVSDGDATNLDVAIEILKNYTQGGGFFGRVQQLSRGHWRTAKNVEAVTTILKDDTFTNIDELITLIFEEITAKEAELPDTQTSSLGRRLDFIASMVNKTLDEIGEEAVAKVTL